MQMIFLFDTKIYSGSSGFTFDLQWPVPMVAVELDTGRVCNQSEKREPD